MRPGFELHTIHLLLPIYAAVTSRGQDASWSAIVIGSPLSMVRSQSQATRSAPQFNVKSASFSTTELPNCPISTAALAPVPSSSQYNVSFVVL
jgi:hypothetical protein